jgi:hypothetical protein
MGEISFNASQRMEAIDRLSDSMCNLLTSLGIWSTPGSQTHSSNHFLHFDRNCSDRKCHRLQNEKNEFVSEGNEVSHSPL